MAKRLFVDALRSVGLVSAGDDPEAKVMLFKSHDTPTEPSEGMIKPSEPPLSGQTIMKETAVAELDLTAIEDADLRAAVSERISKLETDLAEFTAEPEDVVKDAPPEIQAIIKAQEARIEAAEATLAKELEARLDREAVEKAEALPFIGETTELAEILKTAAPEVAGKLLPVLTALNERLRDSDLFKQFGPATHEDADPIEQRDTFVVEYMKDNPDVSQAAARATFWKTHPDLRVEARKDS